jgi:hypothetical protein
VSMRSKEGLRLKEGTKEQDLKQVADR